MTVGLPGQLLGIPALPLSVLGVRMGHWTLVHVIAQTSLPELEAHMGPCLLIYLQQKAINLQGQGVNGRNILVFLLSWSVLLGAEER